MTEVDDHVKPDANSEEDRLLTEEDVPKSDNDTKLDSNAIVDEEFEAPQDNVKTPLSETEFERLHQAFIVSSEKNRNLLFTFILTQLYMLIAIGGTTDVNLLLPDTNFVLPIFNVQLPLNGFYCFAPVLLLLFHGTILLNLSKHLVIMNAWQDASNKNNSPLKFPYIINLLSDFNDKKVKFTIRLLSNILFITFPFLLLVLFQIRYADYHSIPTTIFHFMVVLLDLYIMAIFLNKDSGIFAYIFRQFFVWIFLFVAIFNLCMVYLVVKETGQLYDWLEKNRKIKTFLNSKHYKYAKNWLVPIIDVNEKELVKVRDEHKNVVIGLDYDKITPEFWKTYQRADLKGRHLEMAKLDGVTLYNVDFRGAYLINASLVEAKLQGANLKDTNLKNADLRAANLIGSILKRTVFQGASLVGANLQGANFKFTHFMGANLSFAKLQGAEFFRSNLQGSFLWLVELQGANLRGAILQGADFKEAKLQGADLSGAQLQGAALEKALLLGADLRRTQFQAAYANEAIFEGVDLRSANFFKALQLRTSMSLGPISYKNPVKGIDWLAEESWDDIIFELKKLKKNHNLVFSIATLQNLKSQIRKIDPTQTGDWFSIDEKEKLSDFMKYRRELACTDKWVAKAYVQRYEEGHDLYDEKLLPHIKNSPACVENGIYEFVMGG